MKVKNLLAVAALCLFSSHASAQCRDYNGIYFQYNPTIVGNLDKYLIYDNSFFNSFSMGYVRSIPISSKIPFFLEVGGNLSYGFKSETSNKITLTSHLFSFNIPVHFGYSFGLGSERLALNPYVGMRMRVNAVAAGRLSGGGESETYNYFNKDDMGSDYTWNVFQLGIEGGVKFIINQRFMVEASYTYDVIPFAKVNAKGDYMYPMSINFGFGFCF